jgi:hypothetical protein
LRSLLFSDVDEVFERPIARYVRFALEHRWLLAIMSFAEIALIVVLWRRSGPALGDNGCLCRDRRHRVRDRFGAVRWRPSRGSPSARCAARDELMPR